MLAPGDVGKVGRSLDEFRKEHDPATKIREAIAKLGARGWLYEDEFVKLTGLNLVQFNRCRASFDEFVVQIRGTRPRRAWVGSKLMAEEFRAMVQ